ncbi:MAG: ATP-binding protein, partial [Pseudobdellovibrionaceae bacterium]|nr:ATP-binding protein [Pseudobdellovibrionaceae bacterium]
TFTTACRFFSLTSAPWAVRSALSISTKHTISHGGPRLCWERPNALDRVFALYQSHWQLLKDYAHSTKQHNAGLAGDLPLAALLAPMIELIERTATALKKPYPLIEVSCCELPIRKEWHGPLLDSLTHLLTNAIDHGLEDRDERRASGKAELGCITLHLEPSARGMKLVVSDDGRGIDLEKFRRLAKAPAPDDLSLVKALLFKDGFSTKETVSPHSGRGVGLAAVRDSFESSGLTVDIVLTPADGTARERQALAFVIGFPDDAATPTAA